MSLDQNLFTLFLTPNPSHSAGTVVDLTDTLGTVHYRKRRILSDQQLYRIEVTDPLSDALLASATAPSATTKHKTLELYNPSQVVALTYTGTLSFRWTFTWETHTFEWKREECFLVRKPDPPVLVALTKEPPGRIRTASVQILDYNLNRFEIEDRKGLEIVLLTALLTFQDASDAYHEPGATTPTPPPKPAPKKGVERIAELQVGRGEVNEVTVLEEGAVADYAQHAARLLREDAMLFVSVRASDPAQVPKVLQVVEEIKRLRHKAGDADVRQYVVDDAHKARVIQLDDKGGKGKSKAYTPPTRLTVHLSKIDMPELGPRGTAHDRTRRDHDSDKASKQKQKGKDDRSTRPPPVPPRKDVSVLHKHRSQHDLLPAPSASGAYHAHSVPSRLGGAHTSGRRRRASLDEQGVRHPPTNSSATTPPSGLLGRFLGR